MVKITWITEVADPDRQIRGWPGLPDPEMREGWGTWSQKKFFSALQASVWSKNKGGPRPLPWIRHCMGLEWDLARVPNWQDCQPHTSSNIENWWGRGDRWRHNAWHITSFVKKKKVWKRCSLLESWPNWFTSHQSHYCLYYNGIPEFVRKRLTITVK